MADDADTAEEGSAERPLDESESPCAETRGDAGGSEAHSVSDGDSDRGAGLRSAMVVALVAVLASGLPWPDGWAIGPTSHGRLPSSATCSYRSAARLRST